jgi:hypothetical protein
VQSSVRTSALLTELAPELDENFALGFFRSTQSIECLCADVLLDALGDEIAQRTGG